MLDIKYHCNDLGSKTRTWLKSGIPGMNYILHQLVPGVKLLSNRGREISRQLGPENDIFLILVYLFTVMSL